MNEQGGVWSKERGYIWSMIGSAVGFANILSFSALCYKNGGGAFLIPYIIAHLLIGIPMLFLEGVIGQRTKLPIVSAMRAVSGSKGRMIGWFAIFTCTTVGGFYMVLTGFSVAYTYFSISGMIPLDSAHFFRDMFLHDSGNIGDVGGISLPILSTTLIVAFCVWLVLYRSIRSGIEKVCSLFLPMLALFVLGFGVAVLFLPGSAVGIKSYLLPDFSRLYDWTLWRDVFGQVFFSLSLGLGIVIGYSRHNPSSFSIVRSMYKVALGDFLISFVSGFAIFGCIGFMSLKTQTPFADCLISDAAFEIGFVIFPMILAQFGEGVARIIGSLFFFCIFIAGITGLFSIVESVSGNIEVEFHKSRKKAVGITMLVIIALSIPFCLGNGQQILGAISSMVLGNAMLFGGICEIILFLIFSKAIQGDVIWKKGKSFSYRSLKYFVLPLLTVSLLGALYGEIMEPFTLKTMVRWGWLITAIILSYTLASGSRRELKSMVLD